METRKLIHDLTLGDLDSWCRTAGESSFRAAQIWHWLYVKRVSDWCNMKNLPEGLRLRLAECFLLNSLVPQRTLGEQGGTQKILAAFRDGESVEFAIIPAKRRLTVCVSSQAGCRYGCRFCASGRVGIRRNLETGEIVEQVLAAAESAGRLPTHVVYMGIGEPLDNYESVLRSVRILNDGEGLRIGARRITISTCGIIPGITRLSEEGIQVELSVSLHAPDDALRSEMMPVNRKYPLHELIGACEAYSRKTGRIITFEYVMIAGTNDSREHSEALARLLRPLQCRVNLIPLSTVVEYGCSASDEETCDAFAGVLGRAGINVTVRRSRGASLDAACGQLRSGERGEGIPGPAAEMPS
ncbi:MAG: 23S rRNA (adenine(2503)-C(2))-methyltransferase RlmN [Lentisphaerales bacterium]|nr:MAG: 23S rRNA (adenine(2503)-C(2))-methyltransferase RlmN [Lentisphaerales bacterium]